MQHVKTEEQPVLRKLHKRGPKGRELVGLTIPPSIAKQLMWTFASYVALYIQGDSIIVKRVKLDGAPCITSREDSKS